ncbi:type IV toxin-antitoxin system AbiEi family antitoxin domain-containing protein [Micromonospora sp. NPDC000668]|uniref:type IV toxin-antitoxin system AbiEi family antitoxin domain-containing protein n=1 Tax=Micromonospora sp. NPDC000668 TaxID=3364219 RepID=UPI0036AAC62D
MNPSQGIRYRLRQCVSSFLVGSEERSETGRTPLSALPVTFSYSEALDAGLSEWQLYRLRDQGLIASIGRGLYRRHGAAMADIDLIELARRAPSGTLCLTTALARHGLTDEIPSRIDVALPRGASAGYNRTRRLALV